VFRVAVEEENVKIIATRYEPRETLTLYFDCVLSVDSYNLSDKGQFNLYVSEEQMKEAILARPELIEPGFRPLVVEKNLGEAGFTDIMGEDSKGNLTIVEIKRTTAGRESVMQLNRYLTTIRKDLGRGLRGIIAAPEMRKGTQGLLASMNLEFRSVSPQKCAEILGQRRTRKISEFIKDGTT
jgi:RecB family endonuclease NucS